MARIDELRAQARYHHDRAALYRARMHGPRPTDLARLRELERASDQAQERLRGAERDTAAEPGHPPPA